MGTLTRRAALRDLPAVVCPAALPIAGALPSCGGVVCRVMAQERSRETGIGITPAMTARARDGSDGVFLTLTGDPSTVERFCCGDGVPVMDNREKFGGRDTYTYCPVWQAEQERIADGRSQLAGGGVIEEPEKVSHGDDGRGNVREAPAGSSYAAQDPWAQARRDLDVLAPPTGG
jgi:hypothetical protein